MKEGSGIRVRNVRNCLKRKLCLVFAEDPKAQMSRQEIAQRFGVSIKTVDNTIRQLRAEGIIESARIYKLAPGGRPDLVPQPLGKIPRVPKQPKPQKVKKAASQRPDYWGFGKKLDLQGVWQ